MALAIFVKRKCCCNGGWRRSTRNASTASDATELETVKKNFLIKKLGLADGPKLDEAINAVIDTYGRSERNKYRPVVYYMLVKHFGKEKVYG